MENKMFFKKMIVFVFGFIVLGVIASVLNPSMYFKQEIIEYPIKAEVINVTNSTTAPIGVSGDSDILNFGRLTSTSNSTKFLEFKNGNDVEIKTLFYVSGDIAPQIIVPDNVVLKSGAEAKINVKFAPVRPGNFTGNIKMKSYIPKYPISNWFMSLL